MATRNTMKNAPARPAEQNAAEALRAAVEAFNANAGKRSELSRDDMRALNELRSLADEYVNAADEAWRSERWAGTTFQSPESVRSIAGMVAKYRATCTGSVSLSITSGDEEDGTRAGSVSAPAIESAAVRHHLKKQGAEILSRIDDAIAAGKSRVAAAQVRTRQYEEALDFWTSHSVVGLLLRAWVRVKDAELHGEDSLSDAISTLMLTLSREEGVPEALLAFEPRLVILRHLRERFAAETKAAA